MSHSDDHANNFNLLRFIFACLVIFSHVPELTHGNRSHELLTNLFHTISFGECAVDSFFIISGFLITKSWMHRPDWKHFLLNRTFRIYPGFIVASLICLFLIGPIFSNTHYFESFQVVKTVLKVAFLQLQLPEGLIFPGSHYPVVNGSLWSIPYEFKCYLFVLFAGLTQLLSRKWFMPAAALIATLLYVLIKLNWIESNYLLLNRCLMAYAWGSCYYLFFKQVNWNYLYLTTAVVCLIVFLNIPSLAEPALCIFWSYIIIFFSFKSKMLLSFNKLPDVSYGVYLYAFPINKIVLWYFPDMNILMCLLIVLAGSIIAGIASWYCVEAPGLKLKKMIAHRIAIKAT